MSESKPTQRSCPNCPCFEEMLTIINGWQGLAIAHGMGGSGVRAFDFCPYCGSLLNEEPIDEN